MELMLGFEPKTSSLPRTCSTTELHERTGNFEKNPSRPKIKPRYDDLFARWQIETIHPGSVPEKVAGRVVGEQEVSKGFFEIYPPYSRFGADSGHSAIVPHRFRCPL